jgi:hypothetical protein
MEKRLANAQAKTKIGRIWGVRVRNDKKNKLIDIAATTEWR